MKKYGYILMTFVMASLFSCQKEAGNKVPADEPQVAERTFTVCAPETKTTITGTSFKWAADDKIDVYGYTSGDPATVEKAEFTISEGVGGSVAKFTGTLADHEEYFAVYPSGKTLKTASLNGSIEINSGINGWETQAAVEGGYNPSFALMTAVADGEGKLSFRHGVAYYRIQIPEDNISAVKITFSNSVMQKRPVYRPADGSITAANSGIKEIGIAGTLVKGSYYYICAVPKSDGTAMGSLTVTYTHNGVQKSLTTNSWKTDEPQIGYLYDLGCPPLPVVPPAIVAESLTIEADAVNGSIDYNVTDAVAGGVLTAAVETSDPADWLALGAVGATSVPFTCAANTGATSKTATIRFTYTYDTDKTVTKDVTVTQKAPGASDNHEYIFHLNGSGSVVQTADGDTGSFFTVTGSSKLQCSATGYFGVTGYDIAGDTYTYAKKIDGSNNVSFTTRAGYTTTARFYAGSRNTNTTATINLITGSTKVKTLSLTWTDNKADLLDSGVITLDADKTYTFSKSGEVGVFYIVVNETEE